MIMLFTFIYTPTLLLPDLSVDPSEELFRAVTPNFYLIHVFMGDILGNVFAYFYFAEVFVEGGDAFVEAGVFGDAEVVVVGGCEGH